jgi:hypothetical protein
MIIVVVKVHGEQPEDIKKKKRKKEKKYLYPYNVI